MIFDFLDAIDLNQVKTNGKDWDDNQLGSKVVFNTSNDIDEAAEYDIVIIGAPEERGNESNIGCGKGINTIRQELYQLFIHFEMPKILDLGNAKVGKTIKDSRIALESLLIELHNRNITTIVIGGSNDMLFAQYQSFKEFSHDIDLVVIDEKIDIDEKDIIDASSHLHHILTAEPNFLFTLSHLGHQLFYNSPQNVDKLELLSFESQRLGSLQQNIFDMEPIMRNADILSFDFSAISSFVSPAHAQNSPNGLSGAEACQLCRFAGFSNKLLSFGLYEYNIDYDQNRQGAKQASQMIWYFIEGFTNRKPSDYPSDHNTDFTKFYVKLESEEYELIFWKSNYSGKWWMEIPTKDNDSRYLPCSYTDYKNAMEDELPDSWMKVYSMLN